MRRDAFLDRVRQALARGRAAPVRRAAAGAAELPRRDPPGADPGAWPERFAAELAAVGGRCRLVKAADLEAQCAELAASEPFSRAVAWDAEALAEPGRSLLERALAALARGGTRVTPWRGGDAAALRRAAAAADLGVAVADLAIAASGTAVLLSGPGRGRSVTLLPEQIWLLVPASALRPTLSAALAELAQRQRHAGSGAGGEAGTGLPPGGGRPQNGPAQSGFPQNIVLVTGPSKSADIEMELVHGVHGPRVVTALLVVDA